MALKRKSSIATLMRWIPSSGWNSLKRSAGPIRWSRSSEMGAEWDAVLSEWDERRMSAMGIEWVPNECVGYRVSTKWVQWVLIETNGTVGMRRFFIRKTFQFKRQPIAEVPIRKVFVGRDKSKPLKVTWASKNRRDARNKSHQAKSHRKSCEPVETFKRHPIEMDLNTNWNGSERTEMHLNELKWIWTKCIWTNRDASKWNASLSPELIEFVNDSFQMNQFEPAAVVILQWRISIVIPRSHST